MAHDYFHLPDEIVGCPATYKPNFNEYEVNFQWRIPFSPAGLRPLSALPLTTFSPELKLINVIVVFVEQQTMINAFSCIL